MNKDNIEEIIQQNKDLVKCCNYKWEEKMLKNWIMEVERDIIKTLMDRQAEPL